MLLPAAASPPEAAVVRAVTAEDVVVRGPALEAGAADDIINCSLIFFLNNILMFLK